MSVYSIRKIGKMASPASRPRQVPHSSRLIRPSPSASHRSRKGAVQCSRGLRGAVMGINSRAFTRLGKRITDLYIVQTMTNLIEPKDGLIVECSTNLRGV